MAGVAVAPRFRLFIVCMCFQANPLNPNIPCLLFHCAVCVVRQGLGGSVLCGGRGSLGAHALCAFPPQCYTMTDGANYRWSFQLSIRLYRRWRTYFMCSF